MGNAEGPGAAELGIHTCGDGLTEIPKTAFEGARAGELAEMRLEEFNGV